MGWISSAARIPYKSATAKSFYPSRIKPPANPTPEWLKTHPVYTRTHPVWAQQLLARRQQPAAPQAPNAPQVPAGYPLGTGPEAIAAAELKYGPILRGYEAQQHQSLQQSENIKNWYEDYREQVEDAAEGSEKTFKKAAKQSNKEDKDAAETSGKYMKELNTEEDASAEYRGASPGKEGRVAGVQGIGMRMKDSANFGGLLRSQGALETSYITKQGLIGTTEQARLAATEDLYRRNLLGQIAAAQSEKGMFAQTTQSDMESEAFKRQLLESQFGLKVADTQHDNTLADKTLDQRAMAADRKYQLDKAKFGADQAKDLYLRSHGLGSYKPPAAKAGAKPLAPRAGDSSMAGKLDSVVNQIAYARSQGWGDAKSRQVLAAKKVPPWAVSAGFQIINSKGGISPNTYNYINSVLGYRLPRTGWQVPRYAAPGGGGVTARAPGATAQAGW